METTEVKKQLQKRLEKNFNIFLRITFEGNKLFVLPLKDDIPIINNVTYLSENDELEIKFHFSTNEVNIKNIRLGKNFVCYLDERENLLGLKIINVRDVLKLNPRAVKILNTKNIDVEINDVCVQDSNIRIMHFFKETVKNISSDLKEKLLEIPGLVFK